LQNINERWPASGVIILSNYSDDFSTSGGGSHSRLHFKAQVRLARHSLRRAVITGLERCVYLDPAVRTLAIERWKANQWRMDSLHEGGHRRFLIVEVKGACYTFPGVQLRCCVTRRKYTREGLEGLLGRCRESEERSEVRLLHIGFTVNFSGFGKRGE